MKLIQRLSGRPAKLTKPEARQQLVSVRREMARMERDLSGCDWCCGGGDKDYGWERKREAQALAILGADVIIPKPCNVCHYYDAQDGSETCEKCASVPVLSG
jgi:hypothetical protein